MTDRFSDVFRGHVGKVSDKWSAYLPVYDEVFKDFRNKNIRLLEIGVQNGGSLEVYSKFFTHHEKIIGCDIHPLCANLAYVNPRIKVIVGDCNKPETRAKIFAESETFDLIIDDGSHRSDDIIHSFLAYWPALRPGGVFVAEDLHASYWRSFDGGLFHKQSSMSFFKLLIDIINAEHWGIEASPQDLIAREFPAYRAAAAGVDLAGVASVAFHNSMCVIRKCNAPGEQLLGKRLIRGENPTVVDVRRWNETGPIRSDERGNPTSRF
jgi:hypothetical protein